MKLYVIVLLFFSYNSNAILLSGKVSINNKKGEIVQNHCQNVIVFLENINKDAPQNFSAPKDATLLAKNKLFKPGILPIVKGTKVSFPNGDNILHNVFSLSKTKKFDLGLYHKSAGKSVTFDKAGLVKVYCNIHKGMIADILILDNPLFTKVSKNCTYTIKNIPKGNYKVAAWYKYGTGDTAEVNLSENGTQDFSITQSKSTKSKHKNKSGKTYKKAY